MQLGEQDSQEKPDGTLKGSDDDSEVLSLPRFTQLPVVCT